MSFSAACKAITSSTGFIGTVKTVPFQGRASASILRKSSVLRRVPPEGILL